jgi:hypothetical protein
MNESSEQLHIERAWTVGISNALTALPKPFILITLIEVFTASEGRLYPIKPCHSSPLLLLNKLTPQERSSCLFCHVIQGLDWVLEQ